MNLYTQVYTAPSSRGEPSGLDRAGMTEVEQMLARAAALEAARDLEGAAAIIDRGLHAGRCNAAMAMLFAQMAADLGREREALGAVLGVLGSQAPHPPRTAASLHFAAAQLLERLGRYAEAFEHATRANAPSARTYDRAGMEGMVGGCIADFTPATLGKVRRATNHDQTPVFIVGMPRSGSTLVEQVIASHPQAFGGGELPWVYRLWHRLMNQLGLYHVSLPQALAQMTPDDANAVGSEYLGPLRALQPHAARIVDKNLSNFLQMALIWALFPGARVILCRRNPLDTCVSCYMTDFEEVLPFTCSLPALGHFHRLFDQLMAHWKQVLDLPILEVEYESMVGDLEGNARRVIGFLDLPWDERCLQFHRNRRRVGTASRAQVRRPIYTSSIGRWRHYERYLGPLRESLAC